MRWCRALALAATVASAACGNGAAPPPATGGSGLDPATTATISGRVRFSGEAPTPALIRLDADRTCVGLNGGSTRPAQSLVVGDDQALHHVFVYVKAGLETHTFPVPNQPVVIDQQACQYVPRVVGIRVGQPLQIRNGDPLLHNVRSGSAVNQPFNQGQPVQGMVFNHTFTTREVMMPLTCDVHAWMNAYVGALEHPYFAVTSEGGTFTLPNLPPGTYTIEAWHEQLGTQEATVTVAARDAKDVDFTFSR